MFEVGKSSRDRKGNKVDVVAQILVDTNLPKLLVVTTHEHSCLQTHGTRRLDGRVYNGRDHDSDLVDPTEPTPEERETLANLLEAFTFYYLANGVRKGLSVVGFNKALQVLRNGAFSNS